jgi:hypothetical protein
LPRKPFGLFALAFEVFEGRVDDVVGFLVGVVIQVLDLLTFRPDPITLEAFDVPIAYGAGVFVQTGSPAGKKLESL